jgi:hypothetical protein
VILHLELSADRVQIGMTHNARAKYQKLTTTAPWPYRSADVTPFAETLSISLWNPVAEGLEHPKRLLFESLTLGFGFLLAERSGGCLSSDAGHSAATT